MQHYSGRALPVSSSKFSSIQFTSPFNQLPQKLREPRRKNTRKAVCIWQFIALKSTGCKPRVLQAPFHEHYHRWTEPIVLFDDDLTASSFRLSYIAPFLSLLLEISCWPLLANFLMIYSGFLLGSTLICIQRGNARLLCLTEHCLQLADNIVERLSACTKLHVKEH
jgi:hypothetical protein